MKKLSESTKRTEQKPWNLNLSKLSFNSKQDKFAAEKKLKSRRFERLSLDDVAKCNLLHCRIEFSRLEKISSFNIYKTEKKPLANKNCWL